ncbi:MAG: TauD/TfdA family dioxygenase [Proteobacteria bacterium]|nr:TauD/TfdA family dioxygenase [Pseudomonadota bacterium]
MMDKTSRTQRPARGEAVLLQPVADPAGWRPEDITANEDWVYRFSDDEIAEIQDAAASVEASGRALTDVGRADFPLPKTAKSLAGIYDELKNGRGFVQMRGLPVAAMSRAGAAVVFWGIGTYFGAALSQNAEGHMLGHVKDIGKDYGDPLVRSYQTKAAMAFHNDACDMVALLCLNTAKSGGASRVGSSISVYNEMLKRRPDLAADLCNDLFWTLHGEASPGREPWYKMPVFAVRDGILSVRGASTHARKAQDLPGAERWSATRKAAVDLFQQLSQELAADLPFEPGDLQILNSHVTVHSRRPYEDWDDPAKKRHLFRLWLRNDDLRPVADLVRRNYSGIEIDGFVPNVPMDAGQAA